MRLEKKALCLVLCCALLAGPAAGALEPADTDSLIHKAAVENVLDLGVMSTEEDGSFNPGGTVTRAELCRTVFLVMNGGRELVLPIEETVSTYSDVSASQAAFYIEYCTGLGFAAGRGDGSFDPGARVTGLEYAKMLLGAIGYEADTAGFTGSSWALEVSKRAVEKDLYAGLEDFDAEAVLDRDSAAQLLFNALNAVMVEYEYLLVSINGQLQSRAVIKDYADGRTLLSQKFYVTE